MGIPVGDILRTFVKGGWFRKILDALKGAKITTPGGTEILLDQDEGAVPPLRGSKFDKAPHVFKPPSIGGPRR